MVGLVGQARLWDASAQELWFSEEIAQVFKSRFRSRRLTTRMSKRVKGPLVVHEAQDNSVCRLSGSPVAMFGAAQTKLVGML